MAIPLTVLDYHSPELIDVTYEWLMIHLDSATVDRQWTATDAWVLD